MRTLTAVLMMTMVVGLPGSVLAKSNPQLDPPTILQCAFNGPSPTIDWSDVTSATKYSVEVIAGYDTGGPDASADVYITFSYTTVASALDLPFSALSYDFGSGPISPVSVEVQVKGLNPPGKSQNNPFNDLYPCTLPAA